MMDEKAYNKAVAINMRRIMYEKGISQVDLAKALGYSKQSVSQWMNGAHLPRMEKIDEICKLHIRYIIAPAQKKYQFSIDNQCTLIYN